MSEVYPSGTDDSSMGNEDDLSVDAVDAPGGARKDQLVLAMLAVMGGESRDVNERDLFLACWHAFPNAMRWVDTALPNPDTFTASLRRLDSKGLIRRMGKATRLRRRRRRATPRRPALEPGRSGVVRASIVAGGLSRAGVASDLVSAVRGLIVPPEDYANRTAMDLVLACVSLRLEADRHVDEGSVVETAFHKFPARFAYVERPEWPDVEAVRNAVRDAQDRELLDSTLQLTPAGHRHLDASTVAIAPRLDTSSSHSAGALKFAERIERTEGYLGWIENRTLSLTKGDELYRMLRVPPTTDPQPIAGLLRTRQRELLRVDRADVAAYLLKLAERWNPDVYELVTASTETSGLEDA